MRRSRNYQRFGYKLRRRLNSGKFSAGFAELGVISRKLFGLKVGMNTKRDQKIERVLNGLGSTIGVEKAVLLL